MRSFKGSDDADPRHAPSVLILFPSDFENSRNELNHRAHHRLRSNPHTICTENEQAYLPTTYYNTSHDVARNLLIYDHVIQKKELYTSKYRTLLSTYEA